MRPFEVAYYRNCHYLLSDQKDGLWKSGIFWHSLLRGFGSGWKDSIYLQQNSTYLDAGYTDSLGPLGKFVENSKEIMCHEITGYPIRYSRALWLLELEIRRGRKL